MKIARRTALAAALVASLVTLLPIAPDAAAQTWPNRPIRWVVGFPAGGGSDVIARAIAAAISPALGQPVLVENRPGAAGSIAAEAVARAPADGYTIFTGDNGIMVFNTMVYKQMPYDPVRDFAPVTLIANFPLLLVVPPSSTIRSLGEYVEAARKEPGKIAYGSPGAGSPHHLAMELFRDMAKIDIVHAPYRGGAPAMQDLMAGTVPSLFIDFVSAQGAIKGGKVRALAVSTPRRIAALPDIPTFVESGFPQYTSSAFQGVVVAAATPREIVARLNKELVAAINSPEMTKRLSDLGVEPAAGTPEQFADMLKADRQKWPALIKSRGIQLDL